MRCDARSAAANAEKDTRMFGFRITSVIAMIFGAIFLTLPRAEAQDTDAAKAILEEWLASPHADANAAAFTHWNNEGEIPGDCATCHSDVGFGDFLKTDRSEAGVIDHPVPIGSVVECATCHSDAAQPISSVTFPSTISVPTSDDVSARCMVCHQGRQSTPGVNQAVAGLAEDEVSPDLAFVNVHYRAAAATQLGTEVKGGYEYDDMTYVGQFRHVPGFATCVDCHDPHTLEVSVDECAQCHKTSDPGAIRTSIADFDGDGDASEGIAVEIKRLHDVLGDTIGKYSAEIVGTPTVYGADAYPYFFIDSDADGTAQAEEAQYPNRFQSWTPRMLKAAYNYQFVAKDPGAFAHNSHYALQILYDSIQSLAEQVPVDLGEFERP